MRRSRFTPPDVCPSCGAEVPPKARACPGCGADEETGWSDAARENELGLPDEDFKYDEYVRREFEPARPWRGPHAWVWFVATGLVILGLLALIL